MGRPVGDGSAARGVHQVYVEAATGRAAARTAAELAARATMASAAPRALATFRNLTLNTSRLAGRANIAHARRDLHDRGDAFAVYDI